MRVRGSTARAENRAIPLVHPICRAQTKGLLLVLLVDLHNSTSATEHVQVTAPLPAAGLSNPKVRRASE
jgi:hypothetical protein